MRPLPVEAKADIVCRHHDGYWNAVSADQFGEKSAPKELKHRRVLDTYDRGVIDAEVEKYHHPLENHHPHLYNPVTGQIALTNVNVAESIVIGENMESEYIACLPDELYNPNSTHIKTMSVL